MNGFPVAGTVWQVPLSGSATVSGPPADRFEVVRDSVVWSVRDSVRRAPHSPSSFYRLRNTTPFDQALLARYLLRQEARTATLLPTGTARVELVSDTTLQAKSGPVRVRLAIISAGQGTPGGVWIDERGELLASQVGWFITVRRGHEELLPALRAIETKYRDSKGAALAKSARGLSTHTAVRLGFDEINHIAFLL